jgi:hypothetical protein
MVKLAFCNSYTRFDNLAYDDELPNYIDPAHAGPNRSSTTGHSQGSNRDNGKESSGNLQFGGKSPSRSGVTANLPSDLYDTEPDVFLSEEEDPLF